MNLQTLDDLSLDEFLQNKKIVITGASGFIAHALLKKLSSFNSKILALSRHPEKISLHKSSQISIQKSEDSYDWVKESDIIFHLSAQTYLAESFKNPGKDFVTNVLPLLRILEEAKTAPKPPILIFASTVTIAGIPKQIPVSEETPESPLTFYCFHKKIAENYLKEYTREGWIQGASLRMPNIYGPGPKSNNQERGILNQMVQKAIQGEDLNVYGFGTEIRDYLFIEDTVEALLCASLSSTKLEGKPYVIGTGVGHTLMEAAFHVVDAAKRFLGKTIKIHRRDPETKYKINERNFVANPELFSNLTGWKSNTSLTNGVQQTLLSHL